MVNNFMDKCRVSTEPTGIFATVDSSQYTHAYTSVASSNCKLQIIVHCTDLTFCSTLKFSNVEARI